MNTTTRTIARSIAIAAACGALPAFAQPTNAPPRGPMPFIAFDQDGNGIVTEQEFNTVHAERMAARAATGAPMRGAANAPTFADFDLNGDGRLLPDEFAAAQQSLMQGRPGMGMGPGPGANSSRQGDVLPRITETRYFVRKHDEIPAHMVTGNPEVGSFSQCNACHRGAANGIYDEHQVSIPGHGRW